MAKTNKKLTARLRRRRHIRKKVSGTAARPRLTVFRSAKNISAQIVDDVSGTTLASATSLSKDFAAAGAKSSTVDGAAVVGQLVAKAALDKGITSVVFDRNGFLFHGRIAALANAAREAGLQF